MFVATPLDSASTHVRIRFRCRPTKNGPQCDLLNVVAVYYETKRNTEKETTPLRPFCRNI